MTSHRKQYPFDEIERRWQSHWEENGTFCAGNPGDDGFDGGRPKYYVLDMFPYPSGSGLHVGHAEGYTATDILARYKRKRGFQVLHPMGWDAFGLPAEQYAIKTGQHPRVTTEANTARFREQLKAIGFSYDWSREVNTTDPEYFKWTQWIFLQLYKSYYDAESGRAKPIADLEDRRRESNPDESEEDRRAYLDSRRLAYVAEVPVNWCPKLGTVLANEEIKEGGSEVGGFPVERRPMRQWMLRITDYAQRLIDDLEDLDWPDGIKALQRNWIGRSEGAEVRFALETGGELEVFTTRPDTLFGATYMVLSPEHPFVDTLTVAEHREEVEAYRRAAAAKSDLERTDLAKDKSGVFTGSYAINPVNGEKIPVWIADYVLISYGTGAIMAVPAHDERDCEFAEKFDLEIREVVKPASDEGGCFSGEGVAMNSGFLDGLPTPEAKEKMIQDLEAKGKGRRQVNFKLRDWLFSRQRYWGEPFPVVWRDGRHEAVSEDALPVMPPEMADFKPTGTIEPPLSKAKEWVNVSKGVMRETNTMPQWAGSCWYYMRYCDSANSGEFLSRDAESYWLGGEGIGGVDLYVGGTEHAVLHLLYARFWHKVLFDLGHLQKPEPFQRLVNQGIILGPDGEKMSKSRGNVVTPDEVINNYGADALRLYEMFMGPLDQTKPWSDRGVEGVYRFLSRVWRLYMDQQQDGGWTVSAKIQEHGEAEGDLLRSLHQTIRKVTHDTEGLAFNTAIAEMMKFVNVCTSEKKRPLGAMRDFLHLLNPYAPHLSEELNGLLNEAFPGSAGPELSGEGWPEHDEEVLRQEIVEMVAQVNGKVRDRVRVSADADEEEVRRAVLAAPKILGIVESKEITRIIIIPGKLVNLVVPGA